MGKGGETTSTSEPKYSPELGPIFGRERELLSNIILPQEQQRIKSLGALGRGDFGQAGQILSPALSAARQSQSKLSASLAELPSNVAAPIEEQQARQVRQIPRQ